MFDCMGLTILLGIVIFGNALAAPSSRRYPFPFKHDGLDDGPWRQTPNQENFRDMDDASSVGKVPTFIVPVVIPDRKLVNKLSCCNPHRPPPPCFVKSSFAACLGSGFFSDTEQQGYPDA
ncbi:hypothetical protein RvY_05704 [Ramazzottius varieornatus]|uniref:Uncharacterized protein n=1 Tax=Ramazzottius varieornatus TaxID=947166 RepID=A0A1D1UVY7_RAMVA|nr:hypothetical protein RvY_05704 [Ramazzottius varieornatus]